MSADELCEDGVVALKPEDLRPYGLSRSQAYEMIRAGELDLVKVRGRRFIPKKSLVRLLARGLVPATAGA